MSEDRLARGMQVRREVVGDAYVDRAMATADEFGAPLQELLGEMRWDWLWTRDELPRATRSLLNVAMLSVLNRPNELKVHIQGALRNGCTREEVREALLQSAVYGGMPCGVEGFRVAREAFAEMEKAGA